MCRARTCAGRSIDSTLLRLSISFVGVDAMGCMCALLRDERGRANMRALEMLVVGGFSSASGARVSMPVLVCSSQGRKRKGE